jgi:hypothetical protein
MRLWMKIRSLAEAGTHDRSMVKAVFISEMSEQLEGWKWTLSVDSYALLLYVYPSAIYTRVRINAVARPLQDYVALFNNSELLTSQIHQMRLIQR